jgi:hypothetical protein
MFWTCTYLYNQFEASSNVNYNEDIAGLECDGNGFGVDNNRTESSNMISSRSRSSSKSGISSSISSPLI